MDPMEIARDITVAIISNPNYKPGSGEKEAGIFATALGEVIRALSERKAGEPSLNQLSEAIPPIEDMPTIKDMRSKTKHLKAPVTM